MGYDLQGFLIVSFLNPINPPTKINGTDMPIHNPTKITRVSKLTLRKYFKILIKNYSTALEDCSASRKKLTIKNNKKLIPG